MPRKSTCKRLRTVVQSLFLATAVLPMGGCDPPKPKPENLGQVHFNIPKVDGDDRPLPLPDLTPKPKPPEPTP